MNAQPSHSTVPAGVVTAFVTAVAIATGFAISRLIGAPLTLHMLPWIAGRGLS